MFRPTVRLGFALFTAAQFVFVSSAIGDFTVVLDPGHGGQAIPGKSDSSQVGDGASANNASSADRKTSEKAMTLEYAIEIARALRSSAAAKELGIRVYLTRTSDVHVSAMGRAALAVEQDADVFLSIHFNASERRTASGTKVYYVAGDHPAWNFYHFTNPYVNRDVAFSRMLLRRLVPALAEFGGSGKLSEPIPDSSGRKDGLRLLGYVRQETHLFNAAVALLEVEFLDNAQVNKWLLGPRKSEVRRAAAAAVSTAIVDFLRLKAQYNLRSPKASH